jgi:hypothetical protein
MSAVVLTKLIVQRPNSSKQPVQVTDHVSQRVRKGTGTARVLRSFFSFGLYDY